MRQESGGEGEEHDDPDVLYCYEKSIASPDMQDLEVTCEVSNGISYLKHENEYIIATNGQPEDDC